MVKKPCVAMKNEWSTLIILIIVIIILVWIIVYHRFDSNTKSSKYKDGDFDYSLLPSNNHDGGTYLRRNTSSYKPHHVHKDGPLSISAKLGDIDQSCPCASGLECDSISNDRSGICKRKTGSTCIISSECGSNDLCLLDRCITKPIEYLEIPGGRKIVSLKRHLLKMEHDRFIFPGWWKLSNVISTINSNRPGLIYVSTEKGIYRVPSSIETIKSNELWLNRIKYRLISEESDSNNELISNDNGSSGKLFRFATRLYLITLEGELYQLMEETLLNDWSFIRVKELYQENLINLHIDEVFPGSFGRLSIKIGPHIHEYDINDNKWIQLESNVKKVVYGKDINQRILLYSDQLEGVLIIPINNNKTDSDEESEHKSVDFTLSGEFDDVIFHPNGYQLLVIYHNVVQICKPTLLYAPRIMMRHERGDKPDHRLIIKRETLPGKGKRLYSTGNDVWLLTGNVDLYVQ